ncbi:MAG: hypothetical protein LBU34_17030 [Planctomycetaceae bacterium]|jgi:hypothetical protein|nr:hypothetical protein [Planctomycetaceae bacterium]
MTQFFSNTVNPLLIKELRQFVRNRFIIILLNFYVLAIVVACMMILVTDAQQHTKTIGKDMFFILMLIFFITGFLSVVLRTAWTTATDRINEDLMFYSSIKPSTIVFGKILSGMVMTFVLMSAVMPFVTLAYTLRGIDLIIILEIMIQIFMLLQVLNSFAIFVASSNKFKFSAFLSLLIVGGISFWLGFGAQTMIYEILYHTIHIVDITRVFYFLLYLESVFLVIFISGSTVMLSPPTSNRMFPFRVLLTVIFVISLLVSYSGIFNMPIKHTYKMFIFFSMAIVPFLILAVTCEPDQWSNRIRRHLPKSLIYRAVLFPFYTGAPCGIIWLFMLAAALFWVNNVFHCDMLFFHNDLHFLPGVIILTFNYSVTAMLIRSWCFRKLDSIYVLIIILVLLLTFTVGSMLLHLLLISSLDFTVNDPFIGYSVSPLSALNPFCTFENAGQFKEECINGMLIWFGVLIIFLIIWYSQRLIHFNSKIEEPMTCEEARKFIQRLENS